MPNPPVIVIRLMNATSRGHVRWTPSGQYAYSATVGNATVQVRSRDGDGVAPFALTITAPGKPDVVVAGDSDDRDYNHAFKELYQVAASASVDYAPVVEELLTELDRLDEAPPF